LFSFIIISWLQGFIKVIANGRKQRPGPVQIVPWGRGCVNIRISIFHFQVSCTAPDPVAQIFKSPRLGDERSLVVIYYLFSDSQNNIEFVCCDELLKHIIVTVHY